jgi:hypothetical protein
MKVLPEKYLRLMSAEGRRKHGQKTASEVLEQGEAKSEKMLQKQIVGLLRLKGVQVNVSRMDKRKTDTVGWPDITFSVAIFERVYDTNGEPYEACSQTPCAWEVKMPQGKLSQEQEVMKSRLTTPPNSWRYRVIRSVDQAIAELKEMGVS